MNRRRFGRTAAAAAFAFQVVPSRVFGANERVALAGIGTAGKGATDIAESAKVGFEMEGGTELSPPIVSTVTYEFAKGLKYIWYDGQKGAKFVPETWTLARGEFNRPGNEILNGLDHKKYNVAVVGERATFYFAYARPADWVVFPTGRIDGFAWPAPTLPRAREQNAYAEWQDAIQGKIAQSESHFDQSGPFTEMVLLGVLAQRFPGQKLEWDHEAMAVKGRPELAKYIRREYRDGWKVKA